MHCDGEGSKGGCGRAGLCGYSAQSDWLVPTTGWVGKDRAGPASLQRRV